MKAAGLLFLFALVLPGNLSADELPNNIQGDLGMFFESAQNGIKGNSSQSLLLPYAYFDYGRFFSRIDTFGIKMLPLAYGHLELVGRVRLDGYRTGSNASLSGIRNRQDPLPLGLGSFQLTPVGGFFLYGFHDFNRSAGEIYEATYVAEARLGAATIYPEVGFEYLSNKYAQYYYGVSGAEAATSGYTRYVPGSALNPAASLFVNVPLADDIQAIFYVSRKWFATAIADSPLVDRKFVDKGFLAVVYHFK